MPTPRSDTPHRPTLLARLGLLAAALLPGVAAAATPVVELDCPGGRFTVEAHPWGEDAAGSLRVAMSYRWNDRPLAALRYERHHANLLPWLQRDAARTRDFGLRLAPPARSRMHGDDAGDTLYLSPADATPAQFAALADCLAEAQPRLREAFARAEVRSRRLLGLMSHRAGLPVTGIARLVHAEAPLLGVFGEGARIVVIEADGQVRVLTDYTANNPAEAVLLGRLGAPGRGGRRALVAPARYTLGGAAWETRHLLGERDLAGRTLGDLVTLETTP